MNIVDKRSNGNRDKQAKEEQEQKKASLIRRTRHGKVIIIYYDCIICVEFAQEYHFCEPTINMQTNYTVVHWIMNLFPRRKTFETDFETRGFIT